MCGRLHTQAAPQKGKEPKTEEQFENMNIVSACLQMKEGEECLEKRQITTKKDVLDLG